MNSIDDQLNSLFEKWRKGHVTFTCDGLVYKDSVLSRNTMGLKTIRLKMNGVSPHVESCLS